MQEVQFVEVGGGEGGGEGEVVGTKGEDVLQGAGGWDALARVEIACAMVF